MSILLFGFLLLHLSNCVSSKQSGLEEDAGGALEETTYKDEKLNGVDEKVEKLFRASALYVMLEKIFCNVAIACDVWI